jgi:hypothetical protein
MTLEIQVTWDSDKNVAGWNWLMWFQPDALDYWISSGKTDIDKQFKNKNSKAQLLLKKSTYYHKYEW